MYQSLTLPIPHRVSISAVTLPTPPTPTTATVNSRILYKENKYAEQIQLPRLCSSVFLIYCQSFIVGSYYFKTSIWLFMEKLYTVYVVRHCRLFKDAITDVQWCSAYVLQRNLNDQLTGTLQWKCQFNSHSSNVQICRLPWLYCLFQNFKPSTSTWKSEWKELKDSSAFLYIANVSRQYVILCKKNITS